MPHTDNAASPFRAAKCSHTLLLLQVSGIEKSAQKVLYDLRYVSKKDALRLRSEVAAQLYAAQQQRRAIEKTLWGLTKKGI